MQIEESFRDTKSIHYGMDLSGDSRMEQERKANLLLIAALTLFALWLIGLSLKGSATERQIRVNSGQNRSPYSVIFLARIACRYMIFVLPDDYWKIAQELLNEYFKKLEEG